MSVFFACKQAIQRVRSLGPISVNRARDLRARHIGATALPGGRFDIPSPEDRAKFRALGVEFDKFRAGIERQGELSGDRYADASIISRHGRLVERFGAFGNCGEMSSVAFHFLRQQPISGKVGYITWLDGNHEFIVAGLPSGLSTRRWFYDPDRAPADWGSAAVWCDPWSNNCFDSWKIAPWQTYSKQILRKTMPTITTGEARRATRFVLAAISDCGRRVDL